MPPGMGMTDDEAARKIGRAFRARCARREVAEQKALLEASEDAPPTDGGESLTDKYIQENGKVPMGRVLKLCFSDILIVVAIIIIAIVQIFVTAGFFIAFSLFVDDLTTMDAVSGKSAVVSGGTLVSMLIIAIIMAILIMLKTWLLGIGGNNLASSCRKNLLEAVALQPVSWFDRNRIADISDDLGPSVVLISEGIFQTICNAVWALMMVLTGLIILGIVNTSSMAISLAVLILAITTFIQAEVKEKYIRDLSVAVRQSDVELTEFVTRIRLIRAAATERKEMDDYTERVSEAGSIRKKMAVIDGIFDAINTFIAAAVLLILLWFDGTLVEDGKMSVGKLITAVAVGAMIMYYFRAFFKCIGTLKTSLDSCQLSLHMLTTVPNDEDTVRHLYEGKRADFTGPGTGEIAFNQVALHNPANPRELILNNFTVTIPPGQSMAFVGQAGCGKSFIISLMTRFYRPESGTVSIDGVRVEDYDISYAGQFGLVLQEQMLLNGSIMYNIQYGSGGGVSMEDTINAAKLADAHRFIMRLPNGYNTLVGDGCPVRLAPSQLQRLAIARVFAKNPAMVLLDDPCANLSTANKSNMRLALRRMVRNPVRRTAIVIAHDPEDTEYADTVTTMANGKVVESGAKDILLKDPASYYSRMVDGSLKYVMGRSSMNPSAKIRALDKAGEPSKAAMSKSRSRSSSASVAPAPGPEGPGQV